jgi:hypothetical protein
MCGWSHRYHTHDSRHSASGFPDLVLVRVPRVVFAELKADDAPRRLPLAQASWIAALERCPGCETYIWRPRDWPKVVDILSRRTA